MAGEVPNREILLRDWDEWQEGEEEWQEDEEEWQEDEEEWQEDEEEWQEGRQRVGYFGAEWERLRKSGWCRCKDGLARIISKFVIFAIEYYRK